jgi:hypothetical protein
MLTFKCGVALLCRVVVTIVMVVLSVWDAHVWLVLDHGP